MKNKIAFAALIALAVTLPASAHAEIVDQKGTFVDGDWLHKTQGTAKIVNSEHENPVLRLENFKTTNGPDLYVYLATDDKASEFVSLGRLQSSSGDQEYEIPEGTDLNKYNKVLIWCKAFSVLFGSAELN